MIKNNYKKIAIFNTSISYSSSDRIVNLRINLAFKPSRVLVHFIDCSTLNYYTDSNSKNSSFGGYNYARYSKGAVEANISIIDFTQSEINFKLGTTKQFDNLPIEIIAIE